MSKSQDWFFDLAGKIIQGIGAHTNEAIGKVLQDTDGFEGIDAAFIQIGYAFLPEPITPASYIERGPYTNPAFYQEQMEASTSRGWLQKDADGQYALTEKSKKWAKEFLTLGNKFFGSLPTLSEEETKRLIDLLTKFVEKASKMQDTGNLPTLKIGLKLDPGPDAKLMVRLRRKITDLFYYRDDVHITAWQPYAVEGKAWETLTQVWREDASTATALAENLSQYRNYTEDDYATTLTDLVEKGWIKLDGDKYVATDEGREIREAAEEKTDELFYQPLKVFNDAELAELKSLMKKMVDTLAIPEEDTSEE